ncbi:MAG TPA: hypothetical protein PLN01_04350 [Spirochaetota bacterium]|nr:hypothetical protein [Spirochaetota bacterium]
MRFKKTDRPQKFSFSIETLCRRISTIAAYPSSSTIGDAFSIQQPPRGPFHTVVPRTPSLPSSHERCSIMVLGFVSSARTSACGAYQSTRHMHRSTMQIDDMADLSRSRRRPEYNYKIASYMIAVVLSGRCGSPHDTAYTPTKITVHDVRRISYA